MGRLGFLRSVPQVSTPTSATLLVVDDHADNRDLLRRRLSRQGFTVLEASSGEEALDRIRAGGVDVVILDVMMPGLSGLEVLDRLRSDPRTAELPVLMATARSASEDIVDALGRGANDYVTKPIDFPVLLARLTTLLRGRSGASKPPAAGTRFNADDSNALLDGRYRIESILGAGAYGTVYRGVHLELQEAVAIKILKTSHQASQTSVARFRQEGVAACRVKHPNAVSVVDFGRTDDGVAFLVMELLEGRTLKREMEAGPCAPERAAEIILGVCLALEQAHQRGIIHRDIKPANIFIQRTLAGEVPKVLDFGIAKVVDGAAIEQALTLEGAIVGTPTYMAPERFQGHGCDGKADVYSVGIMFYEMLTGRPPFVVPGPADPVAIGLLHISALPLPFDPETSDSPAELEALVLSALEKRPSERPSAREFAESLARLMQLPITLGSLGADSNEHNETVPDGQGASDRQDASDRQSAALSQSQVVLGSASFRGGVARPTLTVTKG